MVGGNRGGGRRRRRGQSNDNPGPVVEPNSAASERKVKQRRRHQQRRRMNARRHHESVQPIQQIEQQAEQQVATPRSSNAGTNNLPPLTFHQVHGDNIRLCNGNTIARRHESFCKGVTFSARPVRVGEKVCVKFLEISDNWSGVIRFGFTSNDPINLRNGLPRYACPDLTNKPGYWAKALAERFAENDTVLFYYVTSAGDVHFGVNGEEKGVFFSGVETRSPLWAIIDVYGNSTAIEFVDPNRQHFNNVRRGAEHSNEDNAQHSRHSAIDDASNASRDLDRIIVPAMQSVSIHHHQPSPPQHQQPQQPAPIVQQIEPVVASDVVAEPPALRFQQSGMFFAPLPFHSTRGRNICFSKQQCVATRSDTEFCHGYAFTHRPLVLGERLVVQILATEPMYVGALALGLTSCDPANLTAMDLPDDSDLLLDRPEYWVVSKDVASSPQPGDEIAFTVTHFGEVLMSKNGGPANVVMHVDQSLQLWAFVDVYGSTQRVRMFSSRAPSSPTRQQRQIAPSQVAAPAVPVTSQQVSSNHNNASTELSRFSEMVQFKPAVGGGTVLVVSLPPQSPAYPPAPVATTSQPIYASAHRNSTAAATTVAATDSAATYVEPVGAQTPVASSQQHLQQWREGLQPTLGQLSECSICYERSIDCVLYMCGHMCMCYTCALQQWRGKGGGHCPLCRAQIRDVIRIYRS
ncbi:protein neuralized isoform X2 [Trichogramma pretiosum]|uniref:protein neuralized isoform X2 n=1 Tax=Trichogramma pretiosum TaxID=7493 RepID=UPI0006C942E6|nr:protein neuralized isoform X2 [Trichogramma pretiosum]